MSRLDELKSEVGTGRSRGDWIHEALDAHVWPYIEELEKQASAPPSKLYHISLSVYAPPPNMVGLRGDLVVRKTLENLPVRPHVGDVLEFPHENLKAKVTKVAFIFDSGFHLCVTAATI